MNAIRLLLLEMVDWGQVFSRAYRDSADSSFMTAKPMIRPSMTPTISQTCTLGALLSTHRESNDLSIQQVASRAGFDPDVVRSVEADDHSLSIDALSLLLSGYDSADSTRIMKSAILEVNVEDAWVALSLDPSAAAKNDRAADRILAQYLRMLYEQRDVAFGTRVSIREVDLSLVRGSLALRSAEVFERVERLDLSDTEWIETNKLFLLAGLVCAIGVLALGGVQDDGAGEQVDMSQQSGSSASETFEEVTRPTQTPSVGAVRVEIGSAVSITRPPNPVSVEATPVSPASAIISVDIGEAVTLER